MNAIYILVVIVHIYTHVIMYLIMLLLLIGLGVSSVSSANMQAVNSGNCAICSEANIDSVMYRCGHMCVCMPCGLELKSQGLKCPICRAPIADVIRAYTSMQ